MGWEWDESLLTSLTAANKTHGLIKWCIDKAFILRHFTCHHTFLMFWMFYCDLHHNGHMVNMVNFVKQFVRFRQPEKDYQL